MIVFLKISDLGAKIQSIFITKVQILSEYFLHHEMHF